MLQSLANMSGFRGALGLGDRSRAEATSLHRGDRHVDRVFAEAPELRVELEIIAGDLLAGGDVDDGIAFVEHAEIGVRSLAMVHELAVVTVDNAHAVDLEMGIAVARDIVLHVRGQHGDLICVYEDVKLRVQHPKLASAGNEFAGKDAEALNFAWRDVSADE